MVRGLGNSGGLLGTGPEEDAELLEFPWQSEAGKGLKGKGDKSPTINPPDLDLITSWDPSLSLSIISKISEVLLMLNLLH